MDGCIVVTVDIAARCICKYPAHEIDIKFQFRGDVAVEQGPHASFDCRECQPVIGIVCFAHFGNSPHTLLDGLYAQWEDHLVCEQFEEHQGAPYSVICGTSARVPLVGGSFSQCGHRNSGVPPRASIEKRAQKIQSDHCLSTVVVPIQVEEKQRELSVDDRVLLPVATGAAAAGVQYVQVVPHEPEGSSAV